MTRPTRVRIAPSPTGDPHIGTAYMALFNSAFAKKNNGQFIIRIEDTDQKRFRSDTEGRLLKALKWAGLTWDEGPDVGGPHAPYRQSERLPLYREQVQVLLDKGHAYHCFCTEERLEAMRQQKAANKDDHIGYDRHCRHLSSAEVAEKKNAGLTSVVRMKFPTEGVTIVPDQLRGDISFDNATMDDQVLLKTDGFPTYHLAVVVDDHFMEITDVIRGEEWVSSTPKHVQLFKLFGWECPKFYHMPLLRNPDKTKISKRKNPTSILYYKRKGILPEAFLNYLSLMGWNLGTNQEKFTFQEMVDNFSWDRMSLGGPVFDMQKLTWLNGQYLKESDDARWLKLIREEVFSDEQLLKIIPLMRDRVEKLEDFSTASDFFFNGDLNPDLNLMIPKGRTAAEMADILAGVMVYLEALESWDGKRIHDQFDQFMKDKNLKAKDVFMPFRIAVTGRKESPGLMECIEVLGKEMVRRRVQLTIQRLLESGQEAPVAASPAPKK